MSTGADPRLRDYLGHILEAIRKIARYTAGMEEAGFEQAEQTQDAVIRNFEVIGEACRNIERRYPEFVSGHPEVPWALAYEMRNALAHGYFRVDLRIVWETIRTDLPTLEAQVQSLVRELSDTPPS